MTITKLYIVLFFVSFNMTHFVHGFVQKDSLQNYTAAELELKIKKERGDDKKLALVYASEYLLRAKKNSKIPQQRKAYYYLSSLSTRENLVAYADSILIISESKEKDFYSAYSYYIRGTEKYLNQNFKPALKDFVKADGIINESDTLELKFWIKQAIGLLKDRVGDSEGALKELKIALNHFEKEKNWNSYAQAAFSIANVYRKSTNLDSAEYYLRKAKLNLRDSNNRMLNYLEMGTGIVQYLKANYGNSIDILQKSKLKMSALKDKSNTSFCDFYLAKNHLILGDTITAINYFREVDSVFEESSYLHPELRETYIHLIEFNKAQQNTDKELYYVKRLLKLDSLTAQDNSFLRSGIVTDYDMPKLLRRKEELISGYKSKEKKWGLQLVGMLVFSLFILVAFIVYRKKQITKTKTYEKIIDEYNQTLKREYKTVNSSRIPEKDVQIIKAAFKRYEEQKHYAKSSFNKDFIRKDTGINHHYITDYLRDFLGCSLTTYVNDKRIELAVKLIINDSNFRKYTMQAMAETVGYNSVATFKRAFKDRTQMRPLEFVEKRIRKG